MDSKTNSKTHGWLRFAAVSLLTIGGALLLFRPNVWAGPISNPGSTPFTKLGVYQGVIAVIPGEPGNSVMEIGNAGRDIASTGTIWLRPGSLAGDVAHSISAVSENVGGTQTSSLYVPGRLCVAGTCITNWQGLLNGTTNYLAKFSSNTSVGNSILYDTGTNVGISTTSPDTKLHVIGAVCAEASDTGCAPTSGDVRGTRLCIGADCRNAWPSGLSGSGVANRATFWTGLSSLGSDPAFVWDNTNKRLGIGNSNPLSNVVVNKNVTNNGDVNNAVSLIGSSSGSTIYAEQQNTSGWAGYFSGAVNLVNKVGAGPAGTQQSGNPALDFRSNQRDFGGTLAVSNWNTGQTVCDADGDLIIDNPCVGGIGDGVASFANSTGSAVYAEQQHTNSGFAGFFSGRVQINGPGIPFRVNQHAKGPGTVSTSGTSVTGSGTQFSNTFSVGHVIIVTWGDSTTELQIVASIINNTSLTVQSAFSRNESNRPYSVSGGTRMIVLGNGNVGLGSNSPNDRFTVGSSNQFRVGASGDLVRVNNIPYSWPGAQGASNTFLRNDGSGNLTWVAAAGGGNQNLDSVLSFGNVSNRKASFGTTNIPQAGLVVNAYDPDPGWVPPLTPPDCLPGPGTAPCVGSPGDGIAVYANSGNSAIYAEQQCPFVNCFGYAGYFSGNVHIEGALSLSGGCNGCSPFNRFSSNYGSPAPILLLQPGDRLHMGHQLLGSRPEKLIVYGAAAPGTLVDGIVIGAGVLSPSSANDYLKLGYSNTTPTNAAHNKQLATQIFRGGGTGPDSEGSLHIASSGMVTSGISFYTSPDSGATGVLERMKITGAGNVGIGTNSPSALFSVGGSSQFQVSSNGNLARILGVSYTWPGANASGVLTNNGSGGLSWSTSAGGSLPPGTSGQTLRYDASNNLVANSNIFNNGSSIGLGNANPYYSLDILAAFEGVTLRSSNSSPDASSPKLFFSGASPSGVAGAPTPALTGPYIWAPTDGAGTFGAHRLAFFQHPNVGDYQTEREAMTISSDGNVGINHNFVNDGGPDSRLVVKDYGSASDALGTASTNALAIYSQQGWGGGPPSAGTALYAEQQGAGPFNGYGYAGYFSGAVEINVPILPGTGPKGLKVISPYAPALEVQGGNIATQIQGSTEIYGWSNKTSASLWPTNYLSPAALNVYGNAFPGGNAEDFVAAGYFKNTGDGTAGGSAIFAEAFSSGANSYAGKFFGRLATKSLSAPNGPFLTVISTIQITTAVSCDDANSGCPAAGLQCIGAFSAGSASSCASTTGTRDCVCK